MGLLCGLSSLLVLLTVCLSTTNAGNCTDILKVLSRQIMLQQLFVEEMNRADAGSGIKQIRLNNIGANPYSSATHVDDSVAAMHDHGNYRQLVGLGEFIASLNGVNFRTRHNDYKLVRPTMKSLSDDYHVTQDISFPKTPKSVRKKTLVEAQINEMKEFFKAFIAQNPNHKPYEEYFKPVLCYLEGHWTTQTKNLEEPFDSDRHSVEATSWPDLQEKIRFTSFSGRKSNLENFAYLPTTILNVTEEGEPVLAQWNYRILCHPLKTKVPLSSFEVVDDLGPRVTQKSTLEKQMYKESARFKLDPGLVNQLMSEIPGVDNYRGNLNDTAFGLTSYEARDNSSQELKLLNVAYYHRFYESSKKGAQGKTKGHRGFSDDHIFMAMTSNPRVPPVCTYFEGRDEMLGKKVKREECQRWTYAIPLEIIYLTPLATWNPYKITYKGEWYGDNMGREADTVRLDGRNGVQNEALAFNGTNSRTFYQTPAEFFHDKDINGETMLADTSNRNVGVLDIDGIMRIVGPSGVRIMLNIDGVGIFRQRWPIMEVSGQSSPVWKELEALKAIVLGNKEDYAYAYNTQSSTMK